ncbi:MAG: DUF4365 domain-containing protein [Polyangiales bacterium]
MQPRTRRQEDISRAWLSAVCAHAGSTVTVPPDYGQDAEVGFVRRVRDEYQDLGERLFVQLKSTTGADVVDDHIVYDLDAKNYRNLCDRRGLPRVLVLCVLPALEADWVVEREGELALRGGAWWLCLRGEKTSANGGSVRVRIPLAQRFNVDAVRGPLQRFAQTRRPP